MTEPAAVLPPVWTPEQLQSAAAFSQLAVIDRLLADDVYRSAFQAARRDTLGLFTLTGDLRAIEPSLLIERPELVRILRFCFGPPLSNDIVKEHVGGSVEVKQLPPERADAITALVAKGLDELRFPWLAGDRAPTRAERDRAVAWTAGLIALEESRTAARMRPSRQQEEAIREALRAAGFREVARPPAIRLISDLEPGAFTGETAAGGRKADIPARLHDGRLLLIEAKVSSTRLNSYKRLINDSCAKAPVWRRQFGDGGVVPVAVLSGAFSVDHLVLAQGPRYRMYLIWDHDLEALTQFVQQAR